MPSREPSSVAGSIGPMRLDAHYTDPTLVSRYDAENSGRDDTDFYLALADELQARTVVDVGCGTGVLAAALSGGGPGTITGGSGTITSGRASSPTVADATAPAVRRTVVGVDPAAPMLAVARSRAGGDQVTWLEGTADTALGHLGPQAADLALMTGHVAQVFLTDDDWSHVLTTAAALLEPGGHLVFETRDPERRAWTRWTPELTRERSTGPDGVVSVGWVEVTSVDDGLVTFDGHTVLDDGVDRVSSSTLRFRSRDEVERSLDSAGFDVVDVYGDWDRSPVGPQTSELIVVARRR